MGDADQGCHLILEVPVLHRPGGKGRALRNVLLSAVHLAGVGVVVLVLLHVPQRNFIPKAGPVAVHPRAAVVVLGVHSGHVPPARLVELGDIPLQHGQAVQGKPLHTVELGPVGQQAVLRAVHAGHHLIQGFRVVPPAPHRAVVLLGDELLHRGGAAVGAAAGRDAAPGLHLFHRVLRQGHVRVEYLPRRSGSVRHRPG